MTVRLERAVRSIDGVARVHVNRWGDGAAHLHIWFLARPYGALQLQGTFLPMWNDILEPIPEASWRENLALVAAWLAEFGGRAIAEPPHIAWQAPARIGAGVGEGAAEAALAADQAVSLVDVPPSRRGGGPLAQASTAGGAGGSAGGGMEGSVEGGSDQGAGDPRGPHVASSGTMRRPPDVTLLPNQYKPADSARSAPQAPPDDPPTTADVVPADVVPADVVPAAGPEVPAPALGVSREPLPTGTAVPQGSAEPSL